MSDIRTPEEIERELERNRADLQGTLRALEDPFSPDGLFRSLSENVGRHGGDFGRSAMDAARGNPLALGLTAVGLGWLMFGRGPSAERIEREARSDSHRTATTGHTGATPSAAALHDRSSARPARQGWYRASASLRTGPRSGMNSGADRARHGASRAAGRVRDRSSDMARTLSEGTERMNAEARERIVAARERAVLAGEAADRGARRGMQRGADFFDENPLVAGALAVAAGALVAGSLPRTETEDTHLGPQSDALYEEAERLFEEERAKLARVAGAGLDEARSVRDEMRGEADEAARRLKDDADRTTEGDRSAADAAVDRTEEAAERIASAADRQREKDDLGPTRG